MNENLHTPHLIHNLDDIVHLLRLALDDRLDHYHLEIVDIDKFNMHLLGDQFHQTITPSVMKGFIDLQTALYRSYAQIRYNEASTLRLTKQEKRDLEIEVKVIDGSSGFQVDWQELFNKFIEHTVGKMDSKQTFISVLSAIAIFGGYLPVSDYLTNQKEIRLAEIALDKDIAEKQERLATISLASNQNKEVKDVLVEAAKAVPNVKVIQNEAVIASQSLIKNAQAAESIDLNNGAIYLSGDAANELSKSSPNKWREVRIDGLYHIINVDSSHASKRKIRIRNIETQQEILAILENDTLDHKNLNLIQDAEWSYAPIYLKIWAKELNGHHKKAEIKEALLP